MILRPGSNNFSVSVNVRVRFPFQLLIQSRTSVGGRNTACPYIIHDLLFLHGETNMDSLLACTGSNFLLVKRYVATLAV